LTPEGRFIADPTLKKTRNYNADFTVGLTNSFQYKNFDASFLLDWRQVDFSVKNAGTRCGGGTVGGNLFRPEVESLPMEW
jgi:hypothetical protein